MNYFFDFDGTVADTLPDIKRGYIEVMRSMNLPMDEFERKFRIGPPLSEMVREVLPGASEEICRQMASEFRRIYDQSNFPETFAYPGIPETLERLKKQGDRLFIATNKRALPTGLLLKKMKLEHYFEALYCCDTVEKLVKKGDILLLAVEQNKLNIAECVMIGDTATDITAGHYAGMAAFAAAWGYGTREDLLAAKPERLLESPEEI